jgi:hypothetical protein
LAAVGLSGINKIKVLEKDEVIAEIKFQAAPLCLQFYQFAEKDFIMASGM